MDPSAVAWGWPLAALAAGLVAGAVLVWRMRRAPHGPPPETAAVLPLELRDLDGRLDVLLLQLRELVDLAATRNADQLARERYALELQAAEVLRERERHAGAMLPARKGKGKAAAPAPAAEPAAAAVPPPALLATRPDLRGFVWGAATVAALALLFFYVGRDARPREEGGSLTGNLPSSAPPPGDAEPAAPSASDAAEEAEVRAALQRNPDDFDARLDLAMLHLRRRELMAVWDDTQYVLAKQPDHPRALSYQALVRMAMGQSDVALKMLKRALAKDPDLFEGYLHLALVQTRAGHDKEAEAAIAEAARRFPERAEMLARVLPEIRASAQEGGPTSEAADAHAAVPPPSVADREEPPREPTAPPGGGGSGGLAGVIELPAALASRLGPNATVFVTVREAGSAGGPPVAAKRLSAASFPLPFAIGPGDSMMGQPLPGRARLEARVDLDGDAMTRDERDPSARLDDVPAGSSGLRLVLR